MKLLLLTHVAVTLIMFGVILVVQFVHYPLFAKVGNAGYAAYQADHMRLITYVVLVPMVIELLTAIALVSLRPFGIPAWYLWLGLALVAVIWLSTAFLQVPVHQALTIQFDAATHQRLVTTNWIRTVAWTARAVLVVLMLAPLVNTNP